MRMEPAYNSPRQIARDLHHCMLTATGVAQHDQVAFVVLARVVAKRRVEVAGSVVDPDDLAADRRAIHVHVERRHEHRHAMVALARRAVGQRHLRHVAHCAVGAREHERRTGDGRALGVAKEGGDREAQGSRATPAPCHPSTSASAPAASTTAAIVTPSVAIPIVPATRRAKSPARKPSLSSNSAALNSWLCRPAGRSPATA